MSIWSTYPATYRNKEITAIAAAARAGECSAVAGLSGSGKSNLLGFMAHRLGRTASVPGTAMPHPYFVLVDCNRLGNQDPDALFDLIGQALDGTGAEANSYARAEKAVQVTLQNNPGLCILFDRFDALPQAGSAGLFGRLRALRDLFKYELTYVIAARRPPEKSSELAELFFSHTFWLGCLSEEDALWSAAQFATRKDMPWPSKTLGQIVALSRGYPSFLRAVCEAHASGCRLLLPDLLAHPTVQVRLQEFWADLPGEAELTACGLADHPFLANRAAGLDPDADQITAQLTAKEHLLWQYLRTHPGVVCEKDTLIRTIWSEDKIFERGVRDDSLAQLIRRLREKVEADPSNPVHIHTIPGRGYRFIP